MSADHRPTHRSASPVRWRRTLLGAALATTAVGGLVLPSSPARADAPVQINLVTVNDFHGRIERGGSAPGAVGGAAALSTAVKSFRASNPNTVFAAAGDLIGATTFTSFIAQDVPTIQALNAAGLEVSAVGNHELDQGYDDLTNRVMPLADWEYLAANLTPTNGKPKIPDYWTVTFDGVTIGFVGAVTDELPSLVSPAGIAGITVEAPVVAANRVANQLSDGNPANGEADVVILLVHEGAVTTNIASATDPSTRFGQIVNGANANIDAIVSGHTHLAYNHVISGRPVISSGQYGEKFSNMVITVDPATKAIQSMTNTIYDLAPYPDDPALVPLVSAATTNANVLGNVPLGNVTADFNRGVRPTLPSPLEARGTESTLGNFVADVQLWAANQNGSAQIAFMNPGGLRTDIKYAPDGVVTYREAANVQPFANTLVTFSLTGAQVKAVLEQQWQPAGSSRPFLKLGTNRELTYVFDPNAPTGQRITRIMLNGVDIDPAGTYRVVANSFLAAGGDNFTALAGGTGKVDTGKVDLQSMVDWFAAFGTATPAAAQLAVGVHLSPADAGGRDPGDPITIDLSSLDFTTNELKSGTVNVSLGGVPLGSAAVDPTLVDLYDLTGRAQIVTTIPTGLAGAELLTIQVPSTGTTTSVPVVLNDPQQQIASTITGLQALLPGATGPTAKQLRSAIAALTKAADPALWLDPAHPKSDRVFQHDKDALKALTAIKNPSPAVLAAIKAIVGRDRVIAETALAEATAAGGKRSHLAAAARELAAGDRDATRSKWEQANGHYREAWKHAVKA